MAGMISDGRVGLMVPCYIDMFYPEVGVATVELLEKLGVEVEYPVNQTCCGQPMANNNLTETPAGAHAVLPIASYHRLQQIQATYDPGQAIISAHPVKRARH